MKNPETTVDTHSPATEPRSAQLIPRHPLTAVHESTGVAMGQPTSTLTRTTVRQYSRAGALAVWAAAAVPMGLLSWVVAPALAGGGASQPRFTVSLLGALTAGLIWQFALVLAIVAREQRSLRWSVLREALWLKPPTDRAGRRGGRLWWW